MVVGLVAVATSVGNDYYPSDMVLPLPDRPVNAVGGRAFIASTESMTKEEREQAIYHQVWIGNVPSFLLILTKVSNRWVTVDYLAVGSDDDYVRVPMTADVAEHLAQQMGMQLPTPELVDAIYDAADVKLRPQPLSPTDQMTSSEYYLRHNDMIEKQLAGRTGLVAGHKKDLVATDRGVAIYGWHVAPGKPIQPVSRVHGDHYADYSHGVRLVSPATE